MAGIYGFFFRGYRARLPRLLGSCWIFDTVRFKEKACQQQLRYIALFRRINDTISTRILILVGYQRRGASPSHWWSGNIELRVLPNVFWNSENGSVPSLSIISRQLYSELSRKTRTRDEVLQKYCKNSLREFITRKGGLLSRERGSQCGWKDGRKFNPS